MGGGATRERGRPARMHSRSVLLGFPGMRHPTTVPAGTAWARPKQSPDDVAGRAVWRRWPRLCHDVGGRDARAPGWLHPCQWAPKVAGSERCPAEGAEQPELDSGPAWEGRQGTGRINRGWLQAEAGESDPPHSSPAAAGFAATAPAPARDLPRAASVRARTCRTTA